MKQQGRTKGTTGFPVLKDEKNPEIRADPTGRWRVFWCIRGSAHHCAEGLHNGTPIIGVTQYRNVGARAEAKNVISFPGAAHGRHGICRVQIPCLENRDKNEVD